MTTKVRRRESFTMIENSVMEDDRLKPPDIMVYLALATFADCDTGKAWPSISKLCEVSRHSRPTVIKSLRNLEEFGHIEVERKRGKSHTYWLGTSKPVLQGSKVALQGSKAALPEQDLDNKSQEQEGVSAKVNTRGFTDLWREFAGNGAKLLAPDYRKVKTLLGEHSLAELRPWVAAYFEQDWWFTNGQGKAFGPFYSHLGEIVAGMPEPLPERKDVCRHCGVSGGRHRQSCPAIQENHAESQV